MGEVVSVDAFAREGCEEAAVGHFPGVDDDGSGDLGVRVRYVALLSVDDSGDIGE
jgi:hypothetical protein